MTRRIVDTIHRRTRQRSAPTLAAERASDCLDWRRLRREVLEPLLGGSAATWHPFDFAAGQRPDGSYAMSAQTVLREPAPIVLLDGAYSARPELTDLVTVSILLTTPDAVRLQRLSMRESPQLLAAWRDRWEWAEEYYFTHVRPPAAFDLVVEA